MEETNKDFGEVEIYEVGYHILPTVAESEISAEVSKIQKMILDKGGSIISEQFPEMISLTYDIGKKIDTRNLNFNKAYFGWVKFELDRSAISEIKSGIEKMTDILRFIIVKTVRENTIYTPKSLQKKDSDNSLEVEKPVHSEEEIDKSIDELVVGESL